MDEDKLAACSICLNLLEANPYTIIDDEKKQMLQIILPQMDTSLTSLVICNDCTESLHKSYNFRSKYCLNRGKIKMELDEGSGTHCMICRMGQESAKSQWDNILLNRILDTCLPELASRDKGTVCETCMQSLMCHYNLVTNYSIVKEMLQNRLKSENEGNNYSGGLLLVEKQSTELCKIQPIKSDDVPFKIEDKIIEECIDIKYDKDEMNGLCTITPESLAEFEHTDEKEQNSLTNQQSFTELEDFECEIDNHPDAIKKFIIVRPQPSTSDPQVHFNCEENDEKPSTAPVEYLDCEENFDSPESNIQIFFLPCLQPTSADNMTEQVDWHNLFTPRKRRKLNHNPPKTSPEHEKERRRRKHVVKIKTPPKTGAERPGKYRTRQKNTETWIEKLKSNYMCIANKKLPSQDVGVLKHKPSLHYSDYYRHINAHNDFCNKFWNNPFGYSCSVCSRLSFKKDLKRAMPQHSEILSKIVPKIEAGMCIDNISLCITCLYALNSKTIPTISTYNGFKYPEVPSHLPHLNSVSESLISARIPFTQIRRLRHINGESDVYSHVINVSVGVKTKVTHLPRHFDDDYCVNVHIKDKNIVKTSDIQDVVDKNTIKTWLEFLLLSPLYQRYKIKLNESFFKDFRNPDLPRDHISEHIPPEESLTAQQHSLLLLDTDDFFTVPANEENSPENLLFGEHAEELSFPSIYLGQIRTFREGVRVTPSMVIASELRSSDRRGVTPTHLLYMAVKMMSLRVRDSLAIVSKHIDKDAEVARQQVEDERYSNDCMETNFAFLRSIPNSSWYWEEAKRDMFAMIRQLGKPTMYLSLTANEIGWNDLLQTLCKLKHNVEISVVQAEMLHYMEKSTLVNEDTITCALYFNKLVQVLLNVLQSPVLSPFGQYHVVDYFRRIEFPQGGSPQIHVLLWSVIRNKSNVTITSIINNLISVSSKEASGLIDLQIHKHNSTCYKRIRADKPRECRFGAPFMPSRHTVILSPMRKDQPGFQLYSEQFKRLKLNLENNDYTDLKSFYQDNNIKWDADYNNILRAGIDRPTVFLKRQPCEKWHMPFNPFILNIMKSSMNIQFISEEHTCATYIAETINKTNTGISQLRSQMLQTMDEHPELDIAEITKKIGIDILNRVEITTQEAAWYLLQEPITRNSGDIVTIPTMWPNDRRKIRKIRKELNDMENGIDSENIWKDDWFDKYEKRHQDLQRVTLTQFVAHYMPRTKTYSKRKIPRIIRYQNFDREKDPDEYKREMVTLHIPFRNEEEELLSGMKFIKIYDDNEDLILYRRKEFESSFDYQKALEICQNLWREDEIHDDE